MGLVDTIDFAGSSYVNRDGLSRSGLEGFFNPSMLADLLVNAWLPYFECDGCGRWKYCGLADPRYGHRLDPSRNYRCGVARLALSHFLRTAFPAMENAETTQRNGLLDAAYHFAQYVF